MMTDTEAVLVANMEINVLIDEGFEGNLEISWLRNVVEQALIALDPGSEVELGLVITSQEKIRELNRSYRSKDEPTDVLAFAMRPAEPTPGADSPPFIAPPDGVLHLGEVIISYPQAVIQAEEQQHSVKREIAILIIHGLLHLLGYEHETHEQKQLMSAKETEILSHLEKELS